MMRALIFGSMLLLVTDLSGQTLPQLDLSYERAVIKEAGVGSDEAALLAYFKDRTLTDDGLKRAATLVKLLGDDDVKVREKAGRELLATGPNALPLLRKASASGNAEIARRAKELMEPLEKAAQTEQLVVIAAARLLTEFGPQSSASVLLAYTGTLEDDAVEDAVFRALLAICVKDGNPDLLIIEAAGSRLPGQRAAAAFVLGRGKEAGRYLDKLVRDDNLRVRFHAAMGMARAGQRKAVPVLIALLTDASLSQAWRIEESLEILADYKAPRAILGGGSAAARKASRLAWEGWWAKYGAKADLAPLAIHEVHPSRNLTLVIECNPGGTTANTGRIWECGSDGELPSRRSSLNERAHPFDREHSLRLHGCGT